MTARLDGVASAIGNTPLIHLKNLSEKLRRDVFGKAEFMNPGGSIKDRAALAMIVDAEEKGQLQPSGTIVEGTAGNTGIGLAMLAKARGYSATIVMPDNQSEEKYSYLEALGAKVIKVPAVPFANQNHFYHTARRLAEAEGHFWANQFENPANSKTHYETTGPEFWRDAQGRMDAVVMASGTGGTLSGVSRFLKEQLPEIRVVLADPPGSGLYRFITEGQMKAEGSSITEGIGIMRVTANFATAKVDAAVFVPDQKTVGMAHYLVENEGLFVGTSSALNVWAAATVARGLPEGSRVFTILCDGGQRYQKRLFSRAALEEKNLWPVRSSFAELFD